MKKKLNSKNIKLAIQNIYKIIKKKYNDSRLNYRLRIKYEGSNTVLSIPLNDINERKITQLFKNKHIKTYGFYYEKKNIILDS